MASSNILAIDFRRTLPVELSVAVKQYISTKYDQHPDTFKADLETIDRLRNDAVTIHEPHSGGIRRLQMYIAQLVWMGGKFPIDIGADFTWYPSLGYDTSTPISSNNIRFELANVVFNLAVLYCQLGAHTNRSTAEGLKMASNYFCLGAGTISHLKNTLVPDMRTTVPDDMEPMALECLEQLLLAQAQECFWQKAVKDGMKDAIIAKLAAKVSDLYSAASDWAVKSDTISSEWIHHMSAKHHHFAAAAQYRAACDCLEKRKYGEEVARLKDSLNCASEGLKESRYIDKSVSGDLQGLKSKVEDDLKRAEKDNDMIYLMPVPPKPELKTLDRASMVSPKIGPELADPVKHLGENGELGKPLFAKLVPYSVHVAASIYVSRRDQTTNVIIDQIEALNTRIHELLRSLNLPGSLQALEKPLGLPPGLVSHAEEIRQQNGPQRLNRTLDDVNKLRTNDRQTFQEAVGLLKAEAADDDAALRKYGTDRWSRPRSNEVAHKLYGQITEIDGYFKTAESSDTAVYTKIKENQRLIRLLNGTNADLEEFVPSSRQAALTPKMERETNRLRECLNNLSRLETQRKRKIETLRSKGQSDDVNPELIKEASRLEREYPMQKLEAAQFEDFFDKRLERYNADKAMPKEEEREQGALLAQLTEANKSLRTARKGDSSTKEREKALQALENAYFAYKEIVQNLDVGRKFYNDLGPIVGKFRDECQSFAYHRRSEATQLESDIVTSLPMQSLSIASPQATTAANPQSQHSPQRRWTRNQQHAYVERAAATEEPLAAPQPMKPQLPAAVREPHDALNSPTTAVWTPDMPIQFGGAMQQGGQAGTGRGPGGGDGVWDASKGLKFG